MKKSDLKGGQLWLHPKDPSYNIYIHDVKSNIHPVTNQYEEWAQVTGMKGYWVSQHKVVNRINGFNMHLYTDNINVGDLVEVLDNGTHKGKILEVKKVQLGRPNAPFVLKTGSKVKSYNGVMIDVITEVAKVRRLFSV
jgi:hypothetical protein